MRTSRSTPDDRSFYQRLAWLFALLVGLQGLNVFAFSIGDKVQASGLVWVRQTAGGTHVGDQASGAQGTVIGGPVSAQIGGAGNTLTWYNIRWSSAPNGWVGEVGLKAAVVSTSSTTTTQTTSPTVTTPSPSIGSVSPATMPSLNGNQLMTISGGNFQNGATLTFVPPEGGTIKSSAAKLTVVSSSQISYQINNLSDSGVWTVKVNNPDGKSSGVSRFTVTTVVPSTPPSVIKPPPTTPPAIGNLSPPDITSVSPASMPPMNVSQPLIISGDNFQSGATLTFVAPDGASIGSAASKLTFVSGGQINYQINNMSSAGSWTVKVNNPDGKSSGVARFTVAATTAPTLPTVTTPTSSSVIKPPQTTPPAIGNSPAITPNQGKPSTQPVDAQLAREVMDYALLSEEIYNMGTTIFNPPNGWTAVRSSSGNSTKENLENGFKAATFTKGTNLVIVFEGSGLFLNPKNWPDWFNNAAAAVGLPAGQYTDALNYVSKIILQIPPKELKHHNIVITGHSLGGGLATYAAMYSGIPAIVFNAAPVGAGMLEGVNVDLRKSLVKNIDMTADPVSGYGWQIGKVFTLEVPAEIQARFIADNQAEEDAKRGIPFVRILQVKLAETKSGVDAVKILLELHSMETVVKALKTLSGSTSPNQRPRQPKPNVGNVPNSPTLGGNPFEQTPNETRSPRSRQSPSDNTYLIGFPIDKQSGQ